MNTKIATLSAAVLLSAVALTGCAASAPAEKAPEPVSAAQFDKQVTPVTPAESKPAEAFIAPAVVKAPADPEVLANIAKMDNCITAAFTYKIWSGVAVKAEVPAPHQELAKDYVALTEKKIAELGCKTK